MESCVAERRKTGRGSGRLGVRGGQRVRAVLAGLRDPITGCERSCRAGGRTD